jgi:hypothetical protein
LAIKPKITRDLILGSLTIMSRPVPGNYIKVQELASELELGG